MPVLVPTNREDAPLRMLKNNTLVHNTFASSKWQLYELCIVSNRSLYDEVKYALSMLMKIVDVYDNTNKNYMAIECFTIPNVGIPTIDPKFIDKFIDSHNDDKKIEEVTIEFDVDRRFFKIRNIKYHISGWTHKIEN